jgi:DNA-3-methyladenine glycosylase II
MRELFFELRPVPPFRLDLTAWALRRRPSNTIDRWDGTAYRRTFAIEGHPVELRVVQIGSVERPLLSVTARGEWLPSETQAASTGLLERALGLGIDLRPFYRLSKGDAKLRDLGDRFVGVKPPRFPSIFEAIVNGIACQQLSLSVGIILLNRLAACCGLAGPEKDAQHAFPRPSDIAALRPRVLRALGYSEQKAHALLALARNVEEGLDLESMQALDDATAIARLEDLPGIGRWTAEYVLLRGFGRLYLFPGDDVGARTNLARWMKLRTPLDYERVRRLARRWHPYAGLLYFHLLLQKLDDANEIERALTRADTAAHRPPPHERRASRTHPGPGEA